MAYYLNGQKLTEGIPFTVGDFTYPWSYLEILSTIQLTSMGITQIQPQSSFDPKYYWDDETPKNLDDVEEVDPETEEPLYIKVWDPEYDNGEGKQPGAMVNSTERLISKGLKTTCTAEIKAKTNAILLNTDWYVYRKAERDIDVPTDIATHRAAIIAEASRLETAISAAADVEELISIMSSQDWDDSL